MSWVWFTLLLTLKCVTCVQLFDEDGTEILSKGTEILSKGNALWESSTNWLSVSIPPMPSIPQAPTWLPTKEELHRKMASDSEKWIPALYSPEQPTIDKQLRKRESYFHTIHKVRKYLKMIHGVARILSWVHYLSTNDIESMTARFLVRRLSRLPLVGECVTLMFWYDTSMEEQFVQHLARLLRYVNVKSRPALKRFIVWYFDVYQVEKEPRACSVSNPMLRLCV